MDRQADEGGTDSDGEAAAMELPSQLQFMAIRVHAEARPGAMPSSVWKSLASSEPSCEAPGLPDWCPLFRCLCRFFGLGQVLIHSVITLGLQVNDNKSRCSNILTDAVALIEITQVRYGNT